MEYILIYLIVFFPLYSWTAFSAVYYLLHSRGMRKDMIAQRLTSMGYYIHSLILLPLLFLGILTIPSLQLIEITWPSRSSVLWVIVAIPVGTLLFILDSIIIRMLSSSHTEISLVLACSRESLMFFLIPSIEEFLWRGVLIMFFTVDLGSYAFSILVSGLSFGLIHYYFGIKEIGMKTLDGLIYGILFVLSGSFLVSAIAHITYNQLAHGQSVKGMRKSVQA